MKRLLFLAHRVPYPPDKGERLRAYHQIKALSTRFRVTVGALAHSEEAVAAAAGLKSLCEDVLVTRVHRPVALARGVMSLLAGRSLTEGFFRSPALFKGLHASAAAAPYDVAMGYCSGMLDTLLSVPVAGRVLDLVDVDSAKWASYSCDARWPLKGLYQMESHRVDRLEQRAAQTCQAILLVSEDEAVAMGGGKANVHAISNGVDLDYFRPTDDPTGPSVVFTGTMDYRPNIEGVCWFVLNVWPAVRRAVPDAVFTIVGRDPTRAVRALADAAGVCVTGSVPDVRPYLSGAAAAIAPLHIARGVQNKVLEAMAAGKAVVATPAALEGLDVSPDGEVIRAASVRKWVRSLVGLLACSDDARRIGAKARAAVEARYSWAARMAPLVSMCERLAEPEGRRPIA